MIIRSKTREAVDIFRLFSSSRWTPRSDKKIGPRSFRREYDLRNQTAWTKDENGDRDRKQIQSIK